MLAWPFGVKHGVLACRSWCELRVSHLLAACGIDDRLLCEARPCLRGVEAGNDWCICRNMGGRGCCLQWEISALPCSFLCSRAQV